MQGSEFSEEARRFLEALFVDFQHAGVELKSHWDIDHLCYRADTNDHYEEMKKNFSQIGKLLVESPVNGRLISTFKLHTPIIFENRRIDLIELPQAKRGKVTPRGLEHIEVVFDETFSDLLRRYPELSFDEKGLNKEYNQELELVLGERNVKFHHSSLESVVTLEKNTLVWNALCDSGILKHFRAAKPLVVGTFPLGLNVAQSDLDILFQSPSLSDTGDNLRSYYGSCQNFALEETRVDELPALICRFTFKGVPFKVFVQKIAPVHQRAWKHFFMEEKILKHGGEKLREKVMALRIKGLKTEPAFAEVLNLKGDPYEALLKISTVNSVLAPARS